MGLEVPSRAGNQPAKGIWHPTNTARDNGALGGCQQQRSPAPSAVSALVRAVHTGQQADDGTPGA